MNFTISPLISDLLAQSSARHNHLCPRQVLGVRMGLAGLAALGVERPVSKKTALVIIETDGCFADGIEIASGATIGHRTLRVNDLGKIAATFADVKSRRALRLSPAPGVRERARAYAARVEAHYFAQLQGYQLMPESELFDIQEVRLNPSLERLLSKPGIRAECACCGEEIINQREVLVGQVVLCRTCAGQAYYAPEESLALLEK